MTSSNYIEPRVKKKKEIFKNKGLIAKYQNFRGQIKNNHASLKRRRLRPCSFSSPGNAGEIQPTSHRNGLCQIPSTQPKPSHIVDQIAYHEPHFI
jgi:hypothetical protein